MKILTGSRLLEMVQPWPTPWSKLSGAGRLAHGRGVWAPGGDDDEAEDNYIMQMVMTVMMMVMNVHDESQHLLPASVLLPRGAPPLTGSPPPCPLFKE